MTIGRLSRETVEAIYTSKDFYATLMQRHNCTWIEVNRIRGNVQYLRFTALLPRPTRPRTRISEEMKDMIRKSTGTVAEVAREFGMGMNTVCLIPSDREALRAALDPASHSGSHSHRDRDAA